MNTLRSIEAHSLGHAFDDAEVSVFFGDRRSNPVSVSMAFPDFKLLTLKQIHSDLIVQSPSGYLTPEADAHFTMERRQALCVRTADCVPVLIHDPVSGCIAAIHAGWRGIENEIIRKTGDRLIKIGGHPLERARAWIGPHIGVDSFEVGDDVALRLEARLDAVRSFTEQATAIRDCGRPGKKNVDLLSIARAQLRSIGIDPERTREMAIDTFASAEHESFRRDGARALRQMSFIALK